MKKVVQKKTLYVCSKCKTKHSSKRVAEQCERMSIEKKAFRIGDRVRNIEQRMCNAKDKTYIFSGKIIKIIGPEPSDYEYEMKWLGGKRERVNAHVFQYEVEFKCPHCGEKGEHLYYAPELKKI